jgi:hypothetical protein
MSIEPIALQQQATIEIPIVARTREVRVPVKLEVRLSSPADLELGRVMGRVREALRDSHTQLRGGRHVETYADTLRWMLERIRASADR